MSSYKKFDVLCELKENQSINDIQKGKAILEQLKVISRITSMGNKFKLEGMKSINSRIITTLYQNLKSELVEIQRRVEDYKVSYELVSDTFEHSIILIDMLGKMEMTLKDFNQLMNLGNLEVCTVNLDSFFNDCYRILYISKILFSSTLYEEIRVIYEDGFGQQWLDCFEEIKSNVLKEIEVFNNHIDTSASIGAEVIKSYLFLEKIGKSLTQQIDSRDNRYFQILKNDLHLSHMNMNPYNFDNNNYYPF